MQEKVTHRRLPHWDMPGAAYFVTTCLAGSIPAQGLLDIERHRTNVEMKPTPAGMSEADRKNHRWKQMFVRREDWLDHRPAVRFLEDSRLASEVESALKFFHAERYDLIAWVIMPSHYHWVFQLLDSWVDSLGQTTVERSPRERIQQSVNRHSSVRCNRMLGTRGEFWQRESYDHWIRDEAELERIVAYIHANPVVAGLVERAEQYRFSSGYRSEDISAVGHVF